MDFDSIATDEWQALGTDERSSTISFFCGGVKAVKDVGAAIAEETEILVWHGPTQVLEDETGTAREITVFEGYDDHPNEAKYLIEVLHGDELVNHEFAVTEDEAVEVVSEQINKLS